MAVVAASSKDIRSSLGSTVSISGYTASNKYICPSDGYAVIQFGATAPLTGYIYVNGMAMLGGYNVNDYHSASVFVKKGTQLYCGSVTGSTRCYFCPIV